MRGLRPSSEIGVEEKGTASEYKRKNKNFFRKKYFFLYKGFLKKYSKIRIRNPTLKSEIKNEMCISKSVDGPVTSGAGWCVVSIQYSLLLILENEKEKFHIIFFQYM